MSELASTASPLEHGDAQDYAALARAGALCVLLAGTLSWSVFPVGVLQFVSLPACFVMYLLVLRRCGRGESLPDVPPSAPGFAPAAALLGLAIALNLALRANAFTPGHVLFTGAAALVFLLARRLPYRAVMGLCAASAAGTLSALVLNVGLVVLAGRNLSHRVPLTTSCVAGFDLCIVSEHILAGPNYLAMTLCAFALVPWFPLALRLTALAIPIITFTRLPSMLMLLALLPAVAVGPAFVAGLVGTWATGKLDAIVEELWMNRLGAIAFYLSATAPELDLVDFWSQPLDSTLGRIALVATRLVGIDLAWPVFVIGLVLFLLPARQLGWRWAAYALLLFVLEDSARNFSVVLLPLVLCTLRPESST